MANMTPAMQRAGQTLVTKYGMRPIPPAAVAPAGMAFSAILKRVLPGAALFLAADEIGSGELDGRDISKSVFFPEGSAYPVAGEDASAHVQAYKALLAGGKGTPQPGPAGATSGGGMTGNGVMDDAFKKYFGWGPDDITDKDVADLEAHFDNQKAFAGSMLGISILNSLATGAPVQAELADSYKGMKAMRDNLPLLRKQMREGKTPQMRKAAAQKMAELFIIAPALTQMVGAMATQLPNMVGQISYGRDMSGGQVAAANISATASKYATDKEYELRTAEGQDAINAFNNVRYQVSQIARMPKNQQAAAFAGLMQAFASGALGKASGGDAQIDLNQLGAVYRGGK